jgi:CDP-diacylglycerol---glycerol-3-phosphate 3-phosphatidyltransferase
LDLPNLVSLSRMAMALVASAIVLWAWPAGRLWVTVLTATAWLSDMLDGFLARATRGETDAGQSLDLLADKVYILCLLIALAAAHEVPAWVAIVMVARELSVTQMRVFCAGRHVIEQVDALGKLKQGVSMLALLALTTEQPGAVCLLYGAVLLAVISGLHYLATARRHLQSVSASAPGQPADLDCSEVLPRAKTAR